MTGQPALQRNAFAFIVDGERHSAATDAWLYALQLQPHLGRIGVGGEQDRGLVPFVLGCFAAQAHFLSRCESHLRDPGLILFVRVHPDIVRYHWEGGGITRIPLAGFSGQRSHCGGWPFSSIWQGAIEARMSAHWLPPEGIR